MKFVSLCAIRRATIRGQAQCSGEARGGGATSDRVEAMAARCPGGASADRLALAA